MSDLAAANAEAGEGAVTGVDVPNGAAAVDATTGTQLFRPAGTTATERFDLVISPESAGWGYCSLHVLTLAAGRNSAFSTGEQEMILLPLNGGAEVEVDGEHLVLTGRAGVFEGVTDFVYLPRDSQVIVSSSGGGSFALPGARAARRLPMRYAAASEVSIELRGAGQCSRQVNNFATPAAFETDKLIACEVLTPAANWSSYPPHKHDETTDSEAELEEIYYYLFRSARSAQRAESFVEPLKGVGYQRVYGTPERPIDILEEVSDGDAVLIPHGWHGPSIASPSHDMYYLNAMAGPEAERSWRISDDPRHGWVRDTWTGQDVDPRLPFYAAPDAADSAATTP